MRRFYRAILGLLVIGAAASPALAETLTLSGEVTYRERITLPTGAILRVHLVDTAAAADTPARIEAEAAIAAGGRVPLTFTLDFDDRMIEAGHSYALVAEISAGDAVWFRNAEPYAVNPLLPKVPIAIITNFTGTLIEEPRPPVEPEVPATPPPILDVTWQAESIGGHPVVENAETTLSISSDMRTGGRGGCNSYFAQAKLEGESLRFSAVAATRMACTVADITEQEASFFAALAATRFWRLRDGKLVLLDSTGRDIAILTETAR
ncbi:MAG: META domain-containing protein [Devosia sp.]